MSDDFITPQIRAEDIYEGKEFEATPPGVYRMALAGNLRIKKTKDGKRKLAVFFKHTDPIARSRYAGVNGAVMLEGTDKNGAPLARQFGSLLTALGVAKEDVVGGKVSVSALSSLADLPEDEQWKGVDAAITINGDTVDLTGREASVKVSANTFNGKTTMRADAFYPIG